MANPLLAAGARCALLLARAASGIRRWQRGKSLHFMSTDQIGATDTPTGRELSRTNQLSHARAADADNLCCLFHGKFIHGTILPTADKIGKLNLDYFTNCWYNNCVGET